MACGACVCVSCGVATPGWEGDTKTGTNSTASHTAQSPSHLVHLLLVAQRARVPLKPSRTFLSISPASAKKTPPHFLFINTLDPGFSMFVSSLALLALASIPARAQQVDPSHNNVTALGGTWSSGSQHVLTGSVSIVCDVLGGRSPDRNLRRGSQIPPMAASPIRQRRVSPILCA